MKSFLLIAALFSAFWIKAQDTLVYKNAMKMVVVLKEISPNEIRYHKYDLPDGPLYVINKNDIEKIIYKNGTVEVIQPVAATTTPATTVPAQTFGTPYLGKIEYRDAKKSYRTLRDLSLGHHDLKRQPELSELAVSIKKYRAAQDGTRTGAIVCGALALGGTFLYAVADVFDSGNDPVFIAPPIGLGIIAVACTSLSISFNIKLRQKRLAFVNLYNE